MTSTLPLININDHLLWSSHINISMHHHHTSACFMIKSTQHHDTSSPCIHGSALQSIQLFAILGCGLQMRGRGLKRDRMIEELMGKWLMKGRGLKRDRMIEGLMGKGCHKSTHAMSVTQLQSTISGHHYPSTASTLVKCLPSSSLIDFHHYFCASPQLLQPSSPIFNLQ